MGGTSAEAQGQGQGQPRAADGRRGRQAARPGPARRAKRSTLSENHGIVFIDEIDKVAARDRGYPGPSREGVQRDLLPLIEGTTVSTKYGPVKTDHILFIASGAFHVQQALAICCRSCRAACRSASSSRRSTKDDLIGILKDTDASLIKQYVALMATEGLTLDFTD